MHLREQLDKVKGQLGEFTRRCRSCHENAIEFFCYFSIAMVVGMVKNAPISSLETLGTLAIGARLGYTLVYVFGVNLLMSLCRSGFWSVGMYAVFRILMLSL